MINVQWLFINVFPVNFDVCLFYWCKIHTGFTCLLSINITQEKLYVGANKSYDSLFCFQKAQSSMQSTDISVPSPFVVFLRDFYPHCCSISNTICFALTKDRNINLVWFGIKDFIKSDIHGRIMYFTFVDFVYCNNYFLLKSKHVLLGLIYKIKEHSLI